MRNALPEAPEVPIKDKRGPRNEWVCRRMREVIKTTSPHGHAHYFELIYLTQGGGSHTIDFHTCPVGPQRFYLVRPGQVHHWELTQVPKGYVLLLSEDLVADNPLAGLLREDSLGATGPVQDHADEIAALFERIERESDAPAPDSAQLVRSYLQVLLSLLVREQAAAPASRPPEPEQVQVFRRLLEADYRRRFLVHDYAAQLRITPRYLNQLCQQALGTTAGELIARRRLTEARRLLAYTQRTVAQIAFDLSFSDPSHFGKFFRSRTGQSPRQFRSQGSRREQL
ncbi:helix-turn-helix transcriptional regulator [Hymenobacter arizonensis]|uniref:AraC-type DNA-binding protein n=1 Tax=Hymenobacter arizonensis TaxID=1227077 RepID=A0A1I6ABJ6_HYMAR|nr:AraC family transcriptional regulator [Hymenobacter arizonensis]SFQ66106.1 AraC-type DNA-binding protein [Hymenobacter arizonensis]